MQLNYPTKIAWRRYIDEKSFFYYSKSKDKKLKNFLNKLDDCQITYDVITPGEDFYEWFEKAYASMLSAKENALPFDVRNYSLSGGEKMALVIKESGVIIGATIFFVYKKSYNIAFKTYEQKWPTARTLHIGPSLYSEYILFALAKESQRDYVSLGIDRNPYGLNASIGLANYKLSAGYTPIEAKTAETSVCSLVSTSADCLVFHNAASDSAKIKEATLITDTPAGYTMLLSQDTVSISVVKRTEAA